MSRLCAALLLVTIALQGRTGAAESFKPFKLKTLEKTERSLAEVLGKATLVVFFFPTCRFCNAAFPSLQQLFDKYHERGLSVVWINVIPEEERLIDAWRTRHGYTVPVLLGGRSVQRTYRLTTTPTSYLLDSKGTIIAKHEGYKAGDEVPLEQEIQQALK